MITNLHTRYEVKGKHLAPIYVDADRNLGYRDIPLEYLAAGSLEDISGLDCQVQVRLAETVPSGNKMIGVLCDSEFWQVRQVLAYRQFIDAASDSDYRVRAAAHATGAAPGRVVSPSPEFDLHVLSGDLDNDAVTPWIYDGQIVVCQGVGETSDYDADTETDPYVSDEEDDPDNGEAQDQSQQSGGKNSQPTQDDEDDMVTVERSHAWENYGNDAVDSSVDDVFIPEQRVDDDPEPMDPTGGLHGGLGGGVPDDEDDDQGPVEKKPKVRDIPDYDVLFDYGDMDDMDDFNASVFGLKE